VKLVETLNHPPQRRSEMSRAVAIEPARPHLLAYLRAISAPHPNPETERILQHKDAIGAGHTGSEDFSPLVGFRGVDALVTMIERQMLPARIVGAARVAFNTPTPFQVNPAATAGWRAEGTGTAVTPWSAAAVNLPPRTVAALSVVSRELLRHGSPQNEAAVFRLLSSAVAGRVNQTLLSDDAAVPGESPAGLGDFASAVAEGADIAETLQALVDAADTADTDLTAAVFLLSPARAAEAAAALGTDSVGLRGGELLGAPALTDRAAGDAIYLLDASRFAYAWDGPSIESAEHASIEMDDDPDGSSVTPTAANLVSMFQTNSTAFLSELRINWTILAGGAFVAGEES
jgi:hypothetical protein